ncbi:excalibur calcium-binding domain-containing protein [Brachybacterium alimentarium]|uniref:excalibur calcium-binding domain-containing protein n=1 Tax=Brachybacterium alimentarium TaxID=47845 RepID=UPI003FD2B8A1
MAVPVSPSKESTARRSRSTVRARSGPGTVTVGGAPSRPSTPNVAAPIHAGVPGFSTKPDRDGDGVGCE